MQNIMLYSLLISNSELGKLIYWDFLWQNLC